MLAESIGKTLAGGDFGLDNILVMFADWAQKLGSILVAAGLAISGFKYMALENPLGVVRLGGALIAAGAAVKQAVSSNPTRSGSGSSSEGGGNERWDAYGERMLGGAIKIEVNGVIKGSGRELQVVLDNEGKRRAL